PAAVPPTVPVATPVRRTPTPAPPVAEAPPSKPAAPPAAATSEDRATSVVRSYLGALARGDRTTAGSYLAAGSPSETFMSQNASVESVRSEPSGGAYRVTADVKTSGGEYFETFTVTPGPGGLQITEHYWIKPQ
ncbi:MAG: hypothetical protein WBD69_02915, partial [Candidatus Cybelea sp.]